MNYTPKSSKGRSTKAAAKVPEVETLPCRTGTHQLTNVVDFPEPVTICEKCRRTWAELDAAARAITRHEARERGRVA